MLASPLPRSGWIAGSIFVGGGLVVVALSGGCIKGSLATNTGPNGPELWSVDHRQYAAVGEEVAFSFILLSPFQNRPLDPYGFADYCMVSIGEAKIQCEADLHGHFLFEYGLDDVKPGDELEVVATTFRQYGSRDYVKIGDHWLQGDSPMDQPDREVCADELVLLIYQPQVLLEIPSGDFSFDFESGKLELIKRDGTTKSIFIDRPIRRGFETSGPNSQGMFQISYEPDGNEVNPSGETAVRFTVYDTAGHPHSVEATIATP